MTSPSTLPPQVLQGPLLGLLSPAEVKRTLAHAALLTFASGQELLREGEEGTTMLLILAGTVEVRREKRVLAKHTIGEVVGEMGILDPEPQTTTVVAKSKGQALQLHREALMEQVEARDPAAIKIVRALTLLASQRLEQINQLIHHEVVGPTQKGALRRLWGKVTGRH